MTSGMKDFFLQIKCSMQIINNDPNMPSHQVVSVINFGLYNVIVRTVALACYIYLYNMKMYLYMLYMYKYVFIY